MNGARMRFFSMAIAAALVALSGLGCESQNNQVDLQEENLELRARLNAAEAALTDADSERGTLVEQLADLESKNADLKNRPAPEPVVIVKEVEKPVVVAAPPARTAKADAGNGFENIAGVTVEETVGGEITVAVPGDILFSAGKADLKQASKRTLREVAGVLNGQYRGKVVRVEGHTDSDPIVKSKKYWRDNYHLSEARAMSVRDYLTTQGVARSRLTILGHGPDQPVASNKTSTGKAENRRVEIIVVKH